MAVCDMLLPWLSRLVPALLTPFAKPPARRESRRCPMAAALSQRPHVSVRLAAWSALAAILGWSLAAAPALAESAYQVGMGKAVITPEEPMWMSGYGSRNRPAD